MTETIIELLKVLGPFIAGGGTGVIVWLFLGRQKYNQVKTKISTTTSNDQIDSTQKYLDFITKATERINILTEANWKKDHDVKKTRNDLIQLLEMVIEHIKNCEHPEAHFKKFTELLYQQYLTHGKNTRKND